MSEVRSESSRGGAVGPRLLRSLVLLQVWVPRKTVVGTKKGWPSGGERPTKVQPLSSKNSKTYFPENQVALFNCAHDAKKYTKYC